MKRLLDMNGEREALKKGLLRMLKRGFDRREYSNYQALRKLRTGGAESLFGKAQ